MDDRALRDLMMRVARLERESVRYRQGIVADDGPLDVQLGGSTVSYEGVRALHGATVDDDAVVGCLTFGNDLLVLGGVGSQLGVPFVTALPSPAFDGQVVDFDTGTDGVVWRFRYDAGSASSYKWQFIGGPPLTAEVSTSQTTTSASYTDLTTVGPSITLPSVAGDWLIRHGAEMNCSTTNYAFQTVKLGAASAADAEAVIVGGVAAADASAFREIRRDALASGAVLAAKYKAGAGTGQFQKRVLSVIPIRVG